MTELLYNKGAIRSNGNLTLKIIHLYRNEKKKLHSISVLRWCGHFPTYCTTYDIIHISKLLYNDCVFSMRCVLYTIHVIHLYIRYTSRIKYFYRADLAFLYCPFSFYIILQEIRNFLHLHQTCTGTHVLAADSSWAFQRF